MAPRVIFLAPRGGGSGIGDHATHLLDLVRDSVDVVELRHGMPGEETFAQMMRFRREVQDLVLQSPPGVVVHAEVGGGASQSYWAMRRLRVRRTVTVHDAPRPYWFPTLTHALARSRAVRAGLLRALSPIHLAMERRFLAEVDILTMTDVGALSIRQTGLGRHVASTRLLIPPCPSIVAPAHRPAAIGLFGHVYRGKGYELLTAIRSLLPDHIALRVAGRGTETLPRVRGVEIDGAVEGQALADWFASVRAVVLPYRRLPIGGIEAIAASGVHALATGFETPCVALASPSMTELANEAGCDALATLDLVVDRATSLAEDDEAARSAHARLQAYRVTRSPGQTRDAYLRLWGA